jgi:hypothetical protein
MAASPPPLFSSRPLSVRVALAGVIPAALGIVVGLLLDVSSGAYLAGNLVAIIGGFLAGHEHDSFGGAALRGLIAGLVFGVFVLVGHELTGGETTDDLPDPEWVLIPIAGVFSVGLALLGAASRRRLERRA